MDDDKIVVINDQGEEIEFTLLFTIDHPSNGKSYVLYYDENEEEPQVYSSQYSTDGQLFPIETQEEWDFVEEAFSSYIAENDEEESETEYCDDDCE